MIKKSQASFLFGSFGFLLFCAVMGEDSDSLDCKYAVAEISSSVQTAFPIDVCSTNRGSDGNQISSIWTCSSDYQSVVWTLYDTDDCSGSSTYEYTYNVVSENCDGIDDCSMVIRQYVSESGLRSTCLY